MDAIYKTQLIVASAVLFYEDGQFRVRIYLEGLSDKHAESWRVAVWTCSELLSLTALKVKAKLTSVVNNDKSLINNLSHWFHINARFASPVNLHSQLQLFKLYRAGKAFFPCNQNSEAEEWKCSNNSQSQEQWMFNFLNILTGYPIIWKK